MELHWKRVCPLISFAIVYVLVLPVLFHKFVFVTSYSPSHHWPLRFHHSPWLHKDFIVRPENEPTFEPEPPVKCDEDTFEVEESCKKDNCIYNPSAFCIVRWNKRQAELKEDPGLDVDTLLEKFAKATVSPLRIDVETQDENGPSFKRCDYLTEKIIEDMCHTDRKNIRRKLIDNLSLRSCRRFPLKNALDAHLYSLVANSTDCGRILRELLVLDDLVEQLACEYESILHRYDCKAAWSRWECHDCRLAYRDWLCSTFIPYHRNGTLTKPCQSICEQVEQKCPHLHPYGKGQYAGEPVFLCIDPNIPFNEQITPDTPYGTDNNCYNLCELEKCQNEDGENPRLSCWSIKVESTSTETVDNLTLSVSTETVLPTSGTDESLTTVGHELNENELHTVKSGETTVNPNDINENYIDEITGKVSATTFGWNPDEDFYLVPASSDSISKQLQSGQFTELEPNFENSKKDAMFAVNSYDETESTLSSNYQASLQDIYREAMAVTTVDSALSNEAPDKDIILSEELAKEDIQDEWINGNTANQQPTTSTPSPYEPYSELTTVATGTETSRKMTTTIKPNHKDNSPKVKSSTKSGDTGARFRHHNSRTKEQLKSAAEHRVSSEKLAKVHSKENAKKDHAKFISIKKEPTAQHQPPRPTGQQKMSRTISGKPLRSRSLTASTSTRSALTLLVIVAPVMALLVPRLVNW